MTRFLIVDDHPLFLEGIAAVIATVSDIQLVATVSSGEAALNSYRAIRPDVTLMDLQMPMMTGLEAMVAIRKEFPEAKIIILTTYAGDVEGAKQLGAQAYLLKADLDKELLETIRAVHATE